MRGSSPSITTDSRFVHPENALLPICVTPGFTTTFITLKLVHGFLSSSPKSIIALFVETSNVSTPLSPLYSALIPASSDTAFVEAYACTISGTRLTIHIITAPTITVIILLFNSFFMINHPTLLLLL